MGGYGSSSDKPKGNYYLDSKGYKVKDQNAITVGTYYIDRGIHTVFLHENPPRHRADLSVNGRHVEVKGLTTLSPGNIAEKIKRANLQVHGDEYKYPRETWREGKIVLLSRHDSKCSRTEIVSAMRQGYEEARRKGKVDVKVELWIRGEIIPLN